MALNVELIPGSTFPDGTPIDRAALRAGAKPTVAISGTLTGDELEDEAVTAAKLAVAPIFFGADTGTAGTNTYVVNLSPAATGYVAGLRVCWKAGSANTAGATLNVNSLGAKTIKRNFDQALAVGDIKAGQMVEVIFDATNDCWQMVSQVGTPVTVPAAIPAGALTPWAGSQASVPSGWLLCDGSLVSRSTYGDLFTAMGLAYGVVFSASSVSEQLICTENHGFVTGDAVTVQTVGGTLPAGITAGTTYYARAVSATVVKLYPTQADAIADTNVINLTTNGSGRNCVAPLLTFRLPDLRGKTVVGRGGTGATTNGLERGAGGGAETVALTVAQMPKHAHKNNVTGASDGVYTTGNYFLATGGTTLRQEAGRYTGGSGSSATESADQTTDLGASVAHDNMMPFLIANWLVKT